MTSLLNIILADESVSICLTGTPITHDGNNESQVVTPDSPGGVLGAMFSQEEAAVLQKDRRLFKWDHGQDIAQRTTGEARNSSYKFKSSSSQEQSRAAFNLQSVSNEGFVFFPASSSCTYRALTLDASANCSWVRLLLSRNREMFRPICAARECLPLSATTDRMFGNQKQSQHELFFVFSLEPHS